MIRDFYATLYSVGDWDGQEQLAAKQFNRIVDKMAETIGDHPQGHEIMVGWAKRAWDDWGSEEGLLDLNDATISHYIDGRYKLPEAM